MVHFERDAERPGTGRWCSTPGGPVPIAEFLAERDIIVNCTLQDPAAPTDYLHTGLELDAVPAGKPDRRRLLRRGDGLRLGPAHDVRRAHVRRRRPHVHYYGVDHTPSYLWNSATWDISEALIPHLRTVMDGPGAWDHDQTIGRAIQIRDGVIRNPKIPVVPAALRRSSRIPGCKPGGKPGRGHLRPADGRPGPSWEYARPHSRHPAHGVLADPHRKANGWAAGGGTRRPLPPRAWPGRSSGPRRCSAPSGRPASAPTTRPPIGSASRVPAFAFLLGWADRGRAPRRAGQPPGRIEPEGPGGALPRA